MPDAASCSPIHALFVSTIWPSSSSVPIARTSHLTRPPPRTRGHRGSRLGPLPIDVTAPEDLQPGHDGEGDCDREHELLEAEIVRGPRQQHEPNCAVLHDRLVLPEP